MMPPDVMVLDTIEVEQRVGDDVRRYRGTLIFNGENLFTIKMPSGRELTFWHDTTHAPAMRQTVRRVVFSHHPDRNTH